MKRKQNTVDLKNEFCLKFGKSYYCAGLNSEHVMCTVEGCMYVLYIRVDWYINFCDFYKFNSEKSSCFYFQNITGTLKWILFLFNLQIQFTSTAKKKIQNITFKIFVKSPKMGKTIFYYCFLYCTMYICIFVFGGHEIEDNQNYDWPGQTNIKYVWLYFHFQHLKNFKKTFPLAQAK